VEILGRGAENYNLEPGKRGPVAQHLKGRGMVGNWECRADSQEPNIHFLARDIAPACRFSTGEAYEHQVSSKKRRKPALRKKRIRCRCYRGRFNKVK